MMFDTWGGLLTAGAYRAFSLASMRAVLASLAPAPDGRRVPTIVFTKGGGQWLDDIAACGASAVGLDWTVDLADARRRVGAKVALQGNLDPLVLLTDPETVARAGRGRRARPRAPRRGTSSISDTASCRRRLPRMSPRWSKPCIATREKPRRRPERLAARARPRTPGLTTN